MLISGSLCARALAVADLQWRPRGPAEKLSKLSKYLVHTVRYLVCMYVLVRACVRVP